MNMGFGDTPSSPTGTGSHSNFGGSAAASISEGPLQPYVDPTLDAHSIDEHRVEVLERLGFAREAVLKSVTDTKYDAPHAAYMLLAFKLVHTPYMYSTHVLCSYSVQYSIFIPVFSYAYFAVRILYIHSCTVLISTAPCRALFNFVCLFFRTQTYEYIEYLHCAYQLSLLFACCTLLVAAVLRLIFSIVIYSERIYRHSAALTHVLLVLVHRSITHSRAISIVVNEQESGQVPVSGSATAAAAAAAAAGSSAKVSHAMGVSVPTSVPIKHLALPSNASTSGASSKPIPEVQSPNPSSSEPTPAASLAASIARPERDANANSEANSMASALSEQPSAASSSKPAAGGVSLFADALSELPVGAERSTDAPSTTATGTPAGAGAGTGTTTTTVSLSLATTITAATASAVANKTAAARPAANSADINVTSVHKAPQQQQTLVANGNSSAATTSRRSSNTGASNSYTSTL